MGGRGVAPEEAKRGSEGEGWGRVRNRQRFVASYCCNAPLAKLPLSECPNEQICGIVPGLAGWQNCVYSVKSKRGRRELQGEERGER